MAGNDPRWRSVPAVHAASLNGTSSITISRMLWTRALPGTVAMIAALALPEFSLGAGDLDDRQPLGRRAVEPMPADSLSALAPPRSALANVPQGRPPESLRTLLAPVLAPEESATGTPTVETAAFAPETRHEPRPALAAGIAAAALTPASLPLPVDVPALVPEGVSPATPVETMALIEPPVARLSQPSSLSVATEIVAAAAASQPRALGGGKGSFAGLVPTNTGLAGSAAPPEAAIAITPSVPTGLRDAAPGRRPALTELEPVSAAAVSATQAPLQAGAAPDTRAIGPAAAAEPALADALTRFGASAPTLAFSAPPSATIANPASAPMAEAPAVVRPTPQPVPRGVAAPSAPAPAVQPALAVPPPKPALAPAARAPVSAPVAAPAPAIARAASSAATVPGRATRPAAAPAQVAPASANTAALAPLPIAQPQPAASGLGKRDGFAIDIRSQLTTRVDGKAAGKVDFRQTGSGLQVRLGSIVELLGNRYDPAQIARIRESSAGNLYLPLAQLQAQGIPISYDPVYDEFNVGMVDTRPKAARKVHMDQVSAPERGIGSTGIDQVRR